MSKGKLHKCMMVYFNWNNNIMTGVGYNKL